MDESLQEAFENIYLDPSKRKWVSAVCSNTNYGFGDYASSDVETSLRGLEFTIISYNVLADGERYAMSEKHEYCPVEHLDWKVS
mmetsp:Transcript_15528/g.19936  ORF Transcript_15528/g.19936 Transcript_15528/m.19936 type:complete len:84 (-) Transcript_15528:359-610(-)